MGCVETMDKIITYTLRADQPRSDQFYQDIVAFTDEVIAYADQSVGSLAAAYQQAGYEAPRTHPEYLFELLTLGVFWRVYSRRAAKLAPLPQRTLTTLARWRERRSRARPILDTVRGSLITLFLARNGVSLFSSTAPTISDLNRLLDWLTAVGDFEQEVERLRGWQRFFVDQPQDEAKRHLVTILALAEWFEARSLEVLGCYTPHVDSFLTEKHPHYRWREDMIFCGRQRVEYHLNMVGTEIMNRALRDSFVAAAKKVVLLPPCMRARPADQCRARETPFGARCAACEPRCHVHQVTKLGEKHGFAVFMLPDELADLSPGAGTQAAMAELGIVGVSCPLTNVQGGWQVRDLGIPAQGLLLDYCGCSWHWDLDGGIPTDINFCQLLRLLEKTPEKPIPLA